MSLPLEDHVRIILLERERGRRLYEAVSFGWAAFKNNHPRRHLSRRRKSSSRHMFWEEVADRLVQLADDVGVEVLEHRDTLSLIFDNEVMLRLKHADVRLSHKTSPPARRWSTTITTWTFSAELSCNDFGSAMC